MPLQVSREVADAVSAGRPVVALETSIVGQGLPAPHNLRAALESEAAIRHEGGTPATVAVLDGKVRIGLSAADLERVAAGAVKVSSRDLGPAIVRGDVGATTVAATMRAAAMAGIRFFATGGIGGVHRGHPEDQSADLVELGRTSVAVFCAGAKIILDLRLTLERLESLSVPVLGYGTDEFPAFYSAHSGCRVSARVDGPAAACGSGACRCGRFGGHAETACPDGGAVGRAIPRPERGARGQQRARGCAGGGGRLEVNRRARRPAGCKTFFS